MEDKVYCPPIATNKNMLVKQIKDAWDYVKLCMSGELKLLFCPKYT